MEIQKKANKILKVITIVPYRPPSGPIIEEIDDDRLLLRKGSSYNYHIQNESAVDYERIEEHLQDTCEAKMIFYQDAYEEYEEINMNDLEQTPPKFEDMQSQVHDPMEEVNINTMEERKDYLH